MTEKQLQILGFDFTKEYLHDQFKTRRYKKGVMEVEFTYENEKLITRELTMVEINCLPVSLAQMVAIDQVISNYQQ